MVCGLIPSPTPNSEMNTLTEKEVNRISDNGREVPCSQKYVKGGAFTLDILFEGSTYRILYDSQTNCTGIGEKVD